MSFFQKNYRGIIMTIFLIAGLILCAQTAHPQETADDRVYDPNRDTTRYETVTEKVDNYVTLQLMYNHFNKNLIIIYTLNNKEWDGGDAFVIVRNRIDAFMKDHNFYHYKTFSDDTIKYYSKKVVYTRFIYFTDHDASKD